jgi:hypothetical protein
MLKAALLEANHGSIELKLAKTMGLPQHAPFLLEVYQARSHPHMPRHASLSVHKKAWPCQQQSHEPYKNRQRYSWNSSSAASNKSFKRASDVCFERKYNSKAFFGVRPSSKS